MAQEITSTASQNPAATPTFEKEYAGVKISLENCLFPLESIEETPSQKDGLEKEVEENLRRIGCEFIQIAGIMLKVSQVAMATAQVLFQRFFFAKSFVKHKMEETAMACIWLATKVEECPRRVRDVINVFHYLRLKRNKEANAPMVLDQNYVNLKNNVIKAERRILKELGFCVHVKHPHKIIVVYLQVLEMEKNRELVQTAWNYMNDSLQTTVFVQYAPETIACACIYLAARVLQIPLPTRNHWFYLFNATEEDIHKICTTLLCVYQTVKTPYEVLEKKVEDCRAILQQEKLKAKGALNSTEGTASTANSPASRATSPFTNSPKDSKNQDDEKGSVPKSNDGLNLPSTGNGEKIINSVDSDKRNHGNGIKRSRTRSASINRSNKYRRSRQSSGSSSSGNSSPGALQNDDRSHQSRGRSSDQLPKSYSHHINRHSDDKERRRRRKTDGKSRHSKSHRRSDKEGRRSDRDHSRSKRHGTSGKREKRKLSSGDASPHSMPLSSVNGSKMSSTSPIGKKYRHRSRYDADRKKKSRSSHSPSRTHSSSKR